VERCERKLVWPLGMSYPRMFLKLLWRTKEIVRIRDFNKEFCKYEDSCPLGYDAL